MTHPEEDGEPSGDSHSGASPEAPLPVVGEQTPPPFPIVAVGGSAGSLAAFQELLGELRQDNLISLVIISHQDPHQPSLLAEILANATSLPVTQVEENESAEPGHVYVAPPGCYLSIDHNVFHLQRPIERGHPPLPIDLFMRSLAEDRQANAVGIIVSGTGSDGTLGLAAIRDGSGLTMAQRPEEAEFAGMPSSAIAANVVDLVLSPAEMAARLVVHARQLSEPRSPLHEAPRRTEDLEQILDLVASRTGQDFSAYKRGTLRRRIDRRVQLHGLRGLGDYLDFVGAHPEELEALWRDWLIGVTGFFRDPEAFESLAGSILELVRNRPDNSSVRIWVPGCAMGQEAYSIAMLVLEAGEKLKKHLEPQIFATDLDEAAIEAARAGRYPEGIAADLSPERLQKFFLVEDRHYVAKKEVRECIVFAVQNLLLDPPFTRVDLISCRNLLIYLERDAQKHAMSLFHYSLNPGGLLFLGNSESVTGFEDLFSAVDREHKVFRREETNLPMYTPSDWALSTARRPHLHSARVPDRIGPKLDLGELLRRQLTERYAPPGLLVDAQGKVEQIHGRTGDYLEPAPGQPSLNVLDMAREGLRAPLASALREVAEGKQRTAELEARVKTNGGVHPIQVRVTKLSEPRLPRPLFLVSFEPVLEPVSLPPPGSGDAKREVPHGDRTIELEEELRAVRLDHQQTLEELQATNEELASANEEMQSVNEELQSTNEELQTTKEETQSLNEELQTLNSELHAKASSLELVNDDLRNLLDGTGIAIVFVDNDLHVKRFTPAAQALIPLIASDVGRPLGDISMKPDYPDLLDEAQAVLNTLTPIEREVETADQHWYSVVIRPYRTARNTIEGISIAFIDITASKQAELKIESTLRFVEGIIDALREPFLVLDSNLEIMRANQSFYRVFRTIPEETEHRRIFDLGNGHWADPRLRELLEDFLQEEHSIDDFEIDADVPGLGRRGMHLNVRRVDSGISGEPDVILLAIEDVTGEGLPEQPEPAS